MSGLIRELKIGEKIIPIGTVKRASKYIVLTGDDFTDYQSIIELELTRRNISRGTSTDTAKYNLPECYKTELAWSINARSLQNFLSLRTNKAALWEIRELAYALFEALPEEHKFIFEDSIYKEKTPEKNPKE